MQKKEKEKQSKTERRSVSPSVSVAACRPCPVTSHFSFLHFVFCCCQLHSTFPHWCMTVCICVYGIQHLRTPLNKVLIRLSLSWSQNSCFTVHTHTHTHTRDFGNSTERHTHSHLIVMMTVAKRNKHCLAPMCTLIHSHDSPQYAYVCNVDVIINKSTKQNKLWILV